MENFSRRYGGEKNGFHYTLRQVIAESPETQKSRPAENAQPRVGVLFDVTDIVHTLRDIAQESAQHPFRDVAKMLLTNRGSISGIDARATLGEDRAAHLQDNPVRQVVEYDPKGDEFYSNVIIGYNNQLRRSPNFPG